MIIRTINPSDFNFIIGLASLENIKYSKKDLKRIIDFEPEGCFIALDGLQRLGIVTTITYGNVGWIGNLLVEKSTRRRGTGTKLVKEALEYMQKKDVKIPKLYCFPNRVAFYRRLGFKPEINVQVMIGKGRKTAFSEVNKLSEDKLDEIFLLDKKIFGADRSRLLYKLHQEFPRNCFTAYHKKKLVGYIMANGSEDEYELGPWVCLPKYQNTYGEQLLRAGINSLDKKIIDLSTPLNNKK
ncbi:MAG: GNAT family N-acetyltransferase, partial [Melioribacteraceae bacterium]|nr:GNAT family N-acetyltransferase [Melioribacteraceae bacterium]